MKKRIKISFRILISPLLIAACVIMGCGLFGTREPESPTGKSNIWTPPANPQEVLKNISESFSQKDGILYMKSFAQADNSDSGFTFIPDYTSSIYDPTIFEDWKYTEEESFIFSLFAPSFLPSESTATIQFIPESEPPGEICATYYESYNISLHHTNESMDRTYSGRAEISFTRDYTGYWVISKWVDENLGNQPNFTTIKATLFH